MTIALIDGVVQFRGACLLEDAEILLALMVAHPGVAIDLGECTRVHMAVAQIVLAGRPPLHRAPTEPFLRDWLVPILLTATE